MRSDVSAWITALIEQSPALMAVKDLRGNYLLVNDVTETFTGLSRRDLIGRDAAAVFGPETGSISERAAGEALTKRASVQIEIEMRDRILEAVYFPLLTAHGDPYAIGVVAIDVTDSKHQAERLVQAAKMHTVGQLADGMAHDFTNVLHGIQMVVHEARERGRDVSELRSFLDLIQTFISDADQLADRLLPLTRPAQKQIEALDVNDTIQSCWELLDAAAGNAARLEGDLADHLAPVAVETVDLERALFDLVTNARDAIEGSGWIVVRTRMRMQTDEVEITVQDNGRGMDRTIMDKAFEPFFTSSPSRKRRGLGLTLVQAVAVQAGGRTTLESAPGEGTSVSLLLPAFTSPEVDADVEEASPRVS